MQFQGAGHVKGLPRSGSGLCSHRREAECCKAKYAVALEVGGINSSLDMATEIPFYPVGGNAACLLKAGEDPMKQR